MLLPTEDSILYHKPTPVKQGKVFKQKVVVHHRSDTIIQDQVENVKNVQEALKSALEELESAKNAEEISFLEQQVSELKEKSDQMIVVLKIVQKLNSELQYARTDLAKMLKDGDSEEINRTRKRVGWLEDRMEQTLGKKRQRSAHRAASLTVDPRSMLRTEGHRGDRTGYMSDYSSYLPGDNSVRSSTASPLHRAMHHITDDSEVSYPLPLPPKVEDIQGNISEEDSKPVTRHAPREHKRHRQLDIDGESPRQGQRSTFVTQYPLDTPYSDRDYDSPEIISTSPLKVTQHGLETPGGDEDMGSSRSSGRQHAVLPAIAVEIGQLRADSVPSEDNMNKFNVEEYSEDATSTGRMEKDPQRPQSAPSVEVESVQSKLSEKEGSRVTIISPTEELLAIEAPKDLDKDKNAADTYWNSEHHRFEYTEFADNIVDTDPASYHSVGLAVPGTFVHEVGEGQYRLPWRLRSDSELSDVHKIALDKLSVKVHKMYDRVKEASLLSVRPEQPAKKGPSQLLQALEISEGSEAPSTVPSKPTLAKYGLHLKDEVSGFPDVKMSRERLGTSMSGRIVYRPNPLPYPEKLPVTKINKSTEYPPLSDMFSQSVPGQDMAPDRIVDQRNLYNETKFTSSLYRAKVKRSRGDTDSQEAEVKAPPEPAKEKKKRKKKQASPVEEPPSKLGIKSAFNMAKAAVKFRAVAQETGQEKWGDMKPKSGALRHTGLKWERVKNIVHNSLTSANVLERVDAARHLGLLRVCDTMVLYGLKERLQHDDDKRVVYEAAKSLAQLGYWDEEVLTLLVNYLLQGNTHIRADLLKTMIFARNVQYIDKKVSAFSDLVKVLSVMCQVEKPEDRMSFDAAVCLGRMCVYDDNGKKRLKQVIDNSKDTHMRAEAMDILVRQMNCKTPDMVLSCVSQLTTSPVWKYRVDACKLLIYMGPKYAVSQQVIGERVYEALDRKLWDDPNQNVRFESAKALAALELYPYACEKVEKKLGDQNEETRAQAVMSVGTLGMKNERILRSLLEMIDLDSSEYVRIMIIRAFATLHCLDRRVLRVLRDKEKGEGILAREAKKSIDYLDAYAQILEHKKRKKKKKST